MKARGLGRVFPRGEIWWVQYSFRGRRYRESSGSKRRADAVTLLKRRMAEIGRGGPIGLDSEKTTFEDLARMLLEDYQVNGRKSLDRARHSVSHLREFFALSRAVDITPDRVKGYIRSRLSADPSPRPATIHHELAALSRMFTLAVEAGRFHARPRFPMIEVRNTRAGFFELDELRAVIGHLPAHLQPFIEFLFLTGWRYGEARFLTWRQVDFAGRNLSTILRH